MSLIRTITLTTLFLILAALPSQPTQAQIPDVTSQFSCTNVTEIPQIECEALVALYNGIDGPNWNDTTGWLVTNTPCSWYGVGCSSGHVMRLDFDGNKLSGAIPSDIGRLITLTHLDLSRNQLSSIPAEIGNLQSLTWLSLWDNRLNSLPVEIGNFKNLTKLNLRKNQLNNLPITIGLINNLTALDLRENQLSSLPTTVGTLHNLAWLSISSNQLSNLPVEIGNLNNLTSLNLSNNQLNLLPPIIGDLKNLASFDISTNQLSSLPTEIGNLNNLISLELSNNQLSSLPTTIGGLNNLMNLILGNNQLSRLSPEIGNLNNLEWLDLSSNLLQSLPSQIGDLDNLTWLDLSSNQLSSLPPEIGNLKTLAWLVLDFNQLTSLPIEIGNLNNLTRLDLYDNQLNHLPTEIGSLNNLAWFDLRKNQLNNLPIDIGKLENLTTFLLSSNQLNAMPAAIGNLSNLSVLELYSNLLSNLPVEISNLDNLTWLDLSSNQLDNLPHEVGNLNRLTSLWLHNNQLTELPANFVNLTKITNLTLDQNRLAVPDEPLLTWMNTHDLDWAKTQTFGPDNGDSYEPDNTCQSAKSLPINTSAQIHTFHQQDDEDWLTFELESGVKYRLFADSTSDDAEPQMDIYIACDDLPEFPGGPSFGNDAELTFIAPDSGTYYARIRNQNGNIFGADVSYQLTLERLKADGDLAIIITGHDDEFSLQQNIFTAANRAYRTFLAGGIPKNRIRYLGLMDAVGGDERGDADFDGRTDIDTEATVENIETVITQWAVQEVTSESRVFIYMIDHGLVDHLLIDGSDDLLWADVMDGWLDQLETTGASVAVIYEACLSGSFITGDKNISTPERIVMTSTDDNTNAFPQLDGGAHFSDAFFSALRRGKNFYTAFHEAEEASAKTQLLQSPMIDDNGDSRYTRDDGDLARTWRLTNFSGPESSFPTFDTALTPTLAPISDGIGHIQVTTSQTQTIESVWATVYRPDFVEPPTTVDGTMPVLDLDRVELSDNDGDGTYIGLYDNFNLDGIYRFVIYGEDSQGDLLMPVTLEVNLGSGQPSGQDERHKLYLPVIQR